MIFRKTIALVILALTEGMEPPNCPVLSWSDEFDGTSLDTSHWTPQWGDGCQLGQDLCGWGNNEPQWYRPDNAEVSSGTLKLTARRESFQNKEFTSARIRSLNKIEIDLTQDTLVEARIKVPDGGLGIWPAFWMMPSPEVTWPLGGEIDIMEFIGREPFFAQGYIHYGAAFGDKFEKGGPIRLPEPVYEDYHVFSIIKTTNKIAWLIDGHEYQAYTADDIEPKYNWPFEQTYYLILNLATGGYWPGYPEESTVFPTTMEVDYVRVYDLEGGKTVPLIEGTRLVHQNQVQVEYCVNNANGNAITWYVPGDASFVASSTSNCILVDFGLSSGYVKASTATSCTSEGSYSMALPVEVQPFYGVDVSVLDPATTTIEITTGSTRVLEVDGASALQYTRSLDLFDNFFIGMDIPSSDLPDYVSGVRKFFLEIKTTTSAPCTQILIQLEDSALALPDNYGVGRHSRYSCLLEPTRNWQRVACDFIDQPDPSVSTVDRVVVLPDLTLSREDVYYFGSIDVAVSGCTSNCEALQTNGPSTNNCRKASKSEAGACNDGINNNYEGYNGNLVTDCADPVCFDIDPVCGGPPPLESSPSPTALATTRDPSAFPSRSPSLPPIVATTDTPSSSTATSMPSVEPSTSTASPSEELPVSVPPTTSSASMSPAAPTTAGTPFDGPAECSLNPSCVGLVDDCCPTSEDIFLYCCFEEPPSSVGYEKEFTFVGPQAEGERAQYFASSAPYFDPMTAPDGSEPVVAYDRGVQEVYDLIYYETDAISNAGDYVSGNKRFFLDVYSAASECAQILIQMDSLPMASDNEYPRGRHSRYVAFTTKTNEWERLEFIFLDQPDDTVLDSAVNSLVLFFDPGSLRGERYFFRNLDSAMIGCDLSLNNNNCETPSTKSCPAFYNGEDGACDDGIDNDLDGLVDCEDMECASDPVCLVSVSRSYASAKSMLRVEGDTTAGGAGTSSSSERSVAIATTLAVALMAAGAAM